MAELALGVVGIGPAFPRTHFEMLQQRRLSRLKRDQTHEDRKSEQFSHWLSLFQGMIPQFNQSGK
jgi:hypothetical protein